MATAVGIMDKPGLVARTDVIVVADPVERSLLWIPRDLWCELHCERINGAFRRAGANGLRMSLREHGIEVDHVVCLGRDATEAALEGTSVRVFVPRRLEFLYPLPGLDPEDHHTRVIFEPPSEVLSGERIHQWIGSRFMAGEASSDLDRIGRQQLFLTALLDSGFDFSRALSIRNSVSISHPEALAELRTVDSGWRLDTLGGLVPDTVEGIEVLRLAA